MIPATVTCTECGAAVEVPPGVHFATCAHCGSRLALERPLEAPDPAQIRQVQQRTSALEGEIEVARLQQSLEELDLRWRHFNAREAADWSGSADNYLVGVCLVPVIIGLVLLFLGVMTDSGAPNWLALAPGLLLFLAGAGGVAWFGTRAHSRRGAKAGYLLEREAILRRLKELGVEAR